MTTSSHESKDYISAGQILEIALFLVHVLAGCMRNQGFILENYYFIRG